MKPIVPFTFGVLWLTTAALIGATQTESPALPRSTPEAQGISSAAILAFVAAADREIDAMNSFMLVRHGHVVTEGWWAPYSAESPHELYSLSKSFTSTAVGLAVAEGKLSVDDEVLKFFPADAPAEPSANLKALRVRDLLCMSAGHQDEVSSAPDQISPRSFLAHPVPFKPGTHFKYNTPATFMLSAIVQRVTGQTVLEYLQPRLFEPLGMTPPTWGTNSQGITLGGYGLNLRTEDIAKFGQLYLQKGRWNGRQLLPAAWVEAATARQTSNGSNPQSDWDQGYGFQFWRSRHGAYRGDGAFGQYCLVLPEQDAVVAITSGVKDMQSVLNLIWDQLLPAMQPGPLPADQPAFDRLQQKLAQLNMPPQAGDAASSLVPQLWGRKFVFPPNPRKLEAATLEAGPGGEGVTLVVWVNGVSWRLPCGQGVWKKSRFPFGAYPVQPVAASGAWTAADTYAVKICAYETPFYATIRLRFHGDELLHDTEVNVGFGDTKSPPLVGHAE